ncbi:g6520 [Coccomyxa elongata]
MLQSVWVNRISPDHWKACSRKGGWEGPVRVVRTRTKLRPVYSPVTSSSNGDNGREFQLSGSGIDFEPSASCWEVEQSLGGDDITRLLAICWADACLDNNLHILVLNSADTTLPPDVLPFRHATFGVDEFVLKESNGSDNGDNLYDAVLLCGGVKNEAAAPGALLQKVLHVLKPGGVCILLAKRTATAGPPEGKDAVSYPESVRQLFFSVGFCDITELDTSRLRDRNKSSGHGVLCAVLGSRPGTQQGLQAAVAADRSGYSSTSATALAGHGMLNKKDGERSERVQRSWLNAFNAMREEAILIGIPASALPAVTGDASLEELQMAREKMSGMIASFLSSGL